MTTLHAGRVGAALVLDALVGEPAEALHPTVWMGKTIAYVEEPALSLGSPGARRTAGLLLALVLPAAVFLAARGIIQAIPRGLRWPVEVAMLSTTLSMRGLAEAATAVEEALNRVDLVAARTLVGRFVGRDTGELSESEVSRAAVESVAENTSDGVVAPMVYGLLLGAPGALAYKATNTLDSMIGYRESPYTEIGWASARLDDLVNLIPSRLTVLAVAVVGGPRAWETARRFGPLTGSPNAGRVEAAFAGALGLKLGGTNSYGGVTRPGAVLGDGRSPVAADITHAVDLMRRSCLLLAVAAVLMWCVRRG